MKRIALVTVLLLAGCWPFGRRSGAGDDRLRLCVENQTVGYGNVVAHAGLVRFDVMPGQTVCRRLSHVEPSLDLRAVTTGGGVTGPMSFAVRLPTSLESCWHWRLDNTRASGANLMPCREDPEG